jgi:MFS transporter, DHA2 family, multidrug resistance protein
MSSNIDTQDPNAPTKITLSTWLGYTALCVGMFMAILDIQVVVTSLRAIEDALGIGADQMSWIQTSYLIAEVIAIPLTGALIHIFSIRWLFAGAIFMFTCASIGCALSYDFTSLVVCRITQGLSGGVLIPLVFSAIYLLFPRGWAQTLATTIGGVLAVLAPTLGPLVGGWITENYSWHWLFLVNIAPGIAAFAAGVATLPRRPLQLFLLKVLDWISIIYVAASLASLMIGLKQAPTDGWLNFMVLGLFALSAAMAFLSIRRENPAIRYALLYNRHLAYGCILSFLLGAGLFGSVYLMPVFLAFVRNLSPFEIGIVTLVTGTTQLIAAPIIVQMDRRMDARLLSAIGFGIFSIGLAMSGFEDITTTGEDMFWPQVVRGLGVGFCILPPIRFALGFVALQDIPDASGLFNLARNLGGAIGIAVVDTVMFSRSPIFADRILDLLNNDPLTAARTLGLKITDLPSRDDPSGLIGITDLIQRSSFAQAINESWLVLSISMLLAILCLYVMGPTRSTEVSLGEQTDQ